MREIFRVLNQAYQNNQFETILSHQHGNYFLKLRSLSRADILRELAKSANINIEDVEGRQLFEHLFCQNIPQAAIDAFIRQIYQQERALRIQNEEQLYHHLYRINNLDSGGFHQSQVEVYIVKNYIKDISDLDVLEAKIENELNSKIRNYVLWSWYNFWTSILIEDMFKDHRDILPAVGLVKKVDFFWNDFPFDLKVTFFPEGFLREKRRERNLPEREIIELRAFARRNEIPYDRSLSDEEQFNELLNRISESQSETARTFIGVFHQTRSDIVNETIAHPNELIVWFYENQAPRRFDAANRFFLVLIDKNNFEESWKLKRNKDLLVERINGYLDGNRNINFNQFQINFNWEGTNYQTNATCLFIIRE
ncbi:MAG TPA: hypothetical protein VI757_10305 [Bacteroidia bacterium]|nr:hypothetical protein [Bacteroidia bacterium]